ncbi:MAG TPA: hypothetical protein VF503_02405, partial [Sphingobium sp.]|uniref:hypothetical protein n=1 Tax=Sphingobium sp. TaxID=1912891 RepID=UPI002ED030C6
YAGDRRRGFHAGAGQPDIACRTAEQAAIEPTNQQEGRGLGRASHVECLSRITTKVTYWLCFLTFVENEYAIIAVIAFA